MKKWVLARGYPEKILNDQIDKVVYGKNPTGNKSEARKAESGNMEYVKQKFLQSHFLQPDHKGFLKDVEVRLIDETQGSHPTKREFYWMRTLGIFYPDGLNIESD